MLSVTQNKNQKWIPVPLHLRELSPLPHVLPPFPVSTDDSLCHLTDKLFPQLISKSEMKCTFIDKNNPNESSRLSESKHILSLPLFS